MPCLVCLGGAGVCYPFATRGGGAGGREGGDGLDVDRVVEVAVDGLDHAGAGVAEEAGGDERVDAGLLELARVGATEVVGGAGVDVGVLARDGEVAADVVPTLDDGARGGRGRVEDVGEGRGNGDPAAGAGGLGAGEEDPAGVEVDVLAPTQGLDLGGSGAGVDGDEDPRAALLREGGEVQFDQEEVAWIWCHEMGDTSAPGYE